MLCCAYDERAPCSIAVVDDAPRSVWAKIGSAVSEFPSRAVVGRQEEYATISYNHFVSTSKRFFRVTMHVLEFRLNSYVFPFLRRMSTNVADYSMPIIAQVPADACTGILASAASDAVEFWLKHARTYEFEGAVAHVCVCVCCPVRCSCHLVLLLASFVTFSHTFACGW